MRQLAAWRRAALAAVAVLATAGTSLVGISVAPAAAGFPGGNGKIAYERGADIWIMRADGSEQRKLIAGSDPAWSPDGTRLAFIVNADLYVWSAGGVLHNMTTSSAVTEADPAWSPDGNHIAYERGGNVWLLDTTGPLNHRVWISEIAFSHRQPAWSPDGTQILTVREPVAPGDQEIYAVDAAAPWNRTNLTNTPGSDEHHPEWAPGGSRIAYVRAGQLWTMADNGAAQSQVTSIFPNSVEAPSWAPDVSKIAVGWKSGLTTNWEIFTVTDQTWGMTDITNTAAPHREADPSWAAQYPPLTQPDAVAVAEGGAAADNVLSNDMDVFALTRTVEQVTGPAHGTLSLTPGGSFTYQHDGSETVADSFTYKAKDGSIYSAATTVTVTVTPVNDAPVAVNDAYSVVRGAVLKVNGVLDNDTDVDGGGLSATKVTDPAHGTLTLAADGSFTYVNDGSAAIADSFTYRANDGAADSNVATVTIAIKDPVADTVGLVDPDTGIWYLREEPAAIVRSFYYGDPGDVPFFGDWDCDGIDTPGLFRQSDAYAYLRNSNSQGIADIRFFFGNPSDLPLAGDFDGDGCDSLSIYRPSEQRFYIINKLGANNGGLGAADFSFGFGDPGDSPVVGDWDGDGIDEIGLYRESTGFFYYRTTLDTGIASAQFYFGNPGDRFVAGDWGVVDGVGTPAVYRPADTTFYFRTSNTAGPADFTLAALGSNLVNDEPDWLPVAGRFWP